MFAIPSAFLDALLHCNAKLSRLKTLTVIILGVLILALLG